jgi:hypothetical protein
MRVQIVYESLYGNTRLVAEAIGEGFLGSWPDAHVSALEVGEVLPYEARGADLLVVGGPTHILTMTTRRTREMGLRSAHDEVMANSVSGGDPDSATAPGVREWLKALPVAPAGNQAAAFDTRLGSLLAGGAARSIYRRLRDSGYQMVAEPKGFIVVDGRGPLRPGEESRARMWGVHLARCTAGEWLRGISGATGT